MQRLSMGLLLAALWLVRAAAASEVGGEAPAPQPESPRLRSLAAALAAHEPGALDAFWKRVEAEGTPLIENLPGQPGDVLYTFIWRAEPGQVALNVRFNGWFPLHVPPGHFDAFTRLGESNVWYTSYALERTAHLRYELVSPKGWHAAPDRATYFTMDGMEYETFHDPLNPHLLKWNDSVTSYAQGPDATTSPYLEPRGDVPAGTMETLAIDSKVLGDRRSVRIYLPPGYANGARDYGLLLAYDGNQYTTAVPTPTILDNMIAAKAIAPVIAVFMESPDRDVEFPPNDMFQKFVGEELIPQIRAHYRIARDPRRNAVLGSSYGGLAATYTGLLHADLFGNVISQSGSFGWAPEPDAPAPRPTPPRGRGVNPDMGWLIKRVARTPRQPLRFYLDVGTWEGSGALAANRLLHAVLTGKGYNVLYREEPGTHSSYYWMLRLPDALQAELGGAQTARQAPPRARLRGLALQ